MASKRCWEQPFKDLTKRIITFCTEQKKLNGELYEIEELEEKWKAAAASYCADAVPEIPSYPTVAIAWAGYVGMAAASLWDKDWKRYSKVDDLYLFLSKPRGFDFLDEYIAEEYLSIKIDSDDYNQLTSLWQSCAEMALSMIKYEDVEPQSEDAFYLYAEIINLFFVLGVSIRLHELGYKYQKVAVDLPTT